MGGYGSGRPSWHGKAEHCRSLDINKLRRDGALNPGYIGGREWKRDGEVVASIGLRASSTALHLNYRMTSLPDDQAEVSYAVPLTWVPCTKGGSRPYFICPMSRNGRYCGRRVGKLYMRGRWFACRHCHQLAYQSQSEDRHDRLIRRRNKLSARLSPTGEVDTFPPKPKGMWSRTYERRLDEIWRLEAEADAAFVEWVGRRFPGLRLDSIP
jgi:hypothetical protein